MKLAKFAMSALIAAPIVLTMQATHARNLVIVGPGGGYQDTAREHLFKAYEKASGVGVTDEASDDPSAKVNAMVKANDVSWDIVMMGAPGLVKGCEDGTLEPIDYNVVKKAKFIDGMASECGVGAAGWGAAMFYDKSKTPNGPKSFADFFDTKKFPGKRSFPATAQKTLEIALMADGVPRADVYKVLGTPAGVDRAFAKLDTIKKDIVWWKIGAQPLQFVGSGEVKYALGFTGRIQRAINDDKKNYALDWDAMVYSVDSWAVVAGSPMKEEAMKMIDYITDAGPLRAQAAAWPISPATKEVNDDPKVRAENPGMVLNHTDSGLLLNTEFWVTHGDALEQRFAAWAAE